MTTITASTPLGIDLNPALYTSPVVIGSGVTVSNTGYPYTVYRHTGATTFFIIQNDGTILSSRENPKICGIDDAEVVGDLIAVDMPIPRHLLA